MTAIITNQFRLQNLQYTKRDIDSGLDSYYLAIGRAESWLNDALPPLPDVTFKSEIAARQSLQSMKKITDIAYCAPRHNWTSGNFYDAYDDGDPDLFSKSYYVMNTSNFNVYICLRAGSGPSTVEPIGTDDIAATGVAGVDAPIELADGYVWKYLYTIAASDANRFLTADFIPVFRNEDVAANTIAGQIWDIQITDRGVGYNSDPSLTIEGDGSGATATPIILDGELVGINVVSPGSGYTFARVVVSGGSPASPASARPIISPQSLGREIESVDVINGGTSYPNGILDLVVSGDGVEAEISASVSGGVIQVDPAINNPGYGYTTASIVPAESTAGTDAEFIVELSEIKGGFGYNPVLDLNAYYLMFNIVLDGAEGNGDFIPGNNYRQLMIIKNPLDRSNPQRLWQENTAIGLPSLIVTPGGTWVQDDIITGGASGARAYVDYYDPNTETLFFHQTDETGYIDFVDGETLNGDSVSAGAISADLNSANNPSEIDPFSGRMVYLENRVPVSRAPDQSEDIKLVTQF